MTNHLGIKASCRDCTERSVGCHSVCEKYKSYKAELERAKERYEQELQIDGTLKRLKQAGRRDKLKGR